MAISSSRSPGMVQVASAGVAADATSAGNASGTPAALFRLAVSTSRSVAAVLPVCEECASSAITANRRSASPGLSRIAAMANGNVWMVTTTMINLPSPSILARSADLDCDDPSSVSNRRASPAVMTETTPVAGSICRMASCS